MRLVRCKCNGAGVRTDEEGYIEDEENFDEAIRNVNTALSVTKVSLDLCSLALLVLNQSSLLVPQVQSPSSIKRLCETYLTR